ncbi:phosphoribosylamine--glycine ligase [Allobranchiibius huperziae]|uniref:Phosphoribosylamine--glycine ligase n=1 Tax=Allobranchiibius huperziae TaxID=1874116 RepID=A0A853DIW1_9MICO|nr:phosphoribosylamine--glycine ligase [Allobranchiibius huperziae]
MKVLVVGAGAREHALVQGLVIDPDVTRVVAAPGNPGIAELAECRELPDVRDADAIRAIAEEAAVDLVVIGPEVPLVAGVADVLRQAGFAVFGPSGEAARLEGSKAFAKDVMAAADVPTGRCHVCRTEEQVRDALDASGTPYVVKDDGLAAGKGVVVTDDLTAALEHGRACLAAGSEVVVEEFLDGPEVSLFCLTDGETVRALAPAQDFKRALDGDEGPNTGGMGAYSPLDWTPEGLVDDVVRRVAQPTVDEMRRRGTPFVGVLYVGLALTSAGPRVIEFNARFGDPETQVVLARLRTPLGALLYAAATGALADQHPLVWREQSAVTVVIAAENYPASPVTGDEITGIDVSDGVSVLHAGTARRDGSLVSSGGRVLSVVALGDTLAGARAAAYACVDGIRMRGSRHRTDIALAAERGEVHVP